MLQLFECFYKYLVEICEVLKILINIKKTNVKPELKKVL